MAKNGKKTSARSETMVKDAGEESIPLLVSTEQSQKKDGVLKRVLKFHHGFGFVLGFLLGSGLFISPGLVAARSPSMFLALIAWVLCGVISLFGASCYCELASLFRVAGSTTVYVTKIYGPVAGFVWNWSYIFIVSPIAYAIVLTSFGVYLTRMFLADESTALFSVSSRGLGLLLLLILSITNCLGVKDFGRLQNIFAACQVLAVVVFIALGVWQVIREGAFHNIKPEIVMNNTLDVFTWTGLQGFGNAMYAALWAYDGWNCVPYLMEEIQNPSRNVPLVTFISIPFATLVYVILNLSFMTALSKEEMGKSASVGISLAEKVCGTKFTFFMPLLVAVCCFGTINSGVYITARVYMTAARQEQLPSVFSWIHRTRRTPVLAVICNFLLTFCWLATGLDLQTFINYFNVCFWLVYALTFIGLLKLRRSQPDSFRSYKVYAITPVIMTIVSIVIACMGFIATPVGSAISLGLMLSALPVYYACIYKKWLDCIYTTKVEPRVNWVMTSFNMIPSVVDE